MKWQEFDQTKEGRIILSLFYISAPVLTTIGFEVEAYLISVLLLFLTVYRLDVPRDHFSFMDLTPAKLRWLRMHFALFPTIVFVLSDTAANSVFTLFRERGVVAHPIARLAELLVSLGLLVILFLVYTEWPSIGLVKSDRILNSKLLALVGYATFLGLGGTLVLQYAMFPIVALVSLIQGFPRITPFLLGYLDRRGKILKSIVRYGSGIFEWLSTVPLFLAPLLMLNARFLQARITLGPEGSLFVFNISLDPLQLLYMALLASAVLLPIYELVTKPNLTYTLGVFVTLGFAIMLSALAPTAVPLAAFVVKEIHGANALFTRFFLGPVISLWLFGIILATWITAEVGESLIPIDQSKVRKYKWRINLSGATILFFFMFPFMTLFNSYPAATFYLATVIIPMVVTVLSLDHARLEKALPSRLQSDSHLLTTAYAAGLGSILIFLSVFLAKVFGIILHSPTTYLLLIGTAFTALLVTVEMARRGARSALGYWSGSIVAVTLTFSIFVQRMLGLINLIDASLSVISTLTIIFLGSLYLRRKTR